MYLSSVLDELFIHNEVKQNSFYNSFIIQTVFKHNNIYKYFLDKNTKFFYKYFIGICVFLYLSQ